MHALFAKDRTPCTTHNRGHGFTLIELLVVISIISMLLSISLPVLNLVRRQARTAVGRSHQRSIARAVNLFAMENDDQYPESVATLVLRDNWNWQEPTMLISDKKRSPTLYRSISAYLRQYINDASVMFCPSAPREHKYLQQAWEAGEDWRNPEAPQGPMIGTYGFYWNYVGFLGERRGLFRGPRSTAGGTRQSKLLVACYFGYDHWQNRNAYSSCEKFSSAGLTEETWFSPAVWSDSNSNTSLDTLKMKLQAGYTDEHVESYGPAEVMPMEVIADPLTGAPYPSVTGPGVFYLPPDSLH